MAGLWPAGWAPKGPASVTPCSAASPVILTVALPDALQQQACAVRAHRSPDAAGRAPAHISLFRHLPGLHRDALVTDIRALVGSQPAPRLPFDLPVRWGGLWVARARCPELDRLRAELADRWHGLLAPGDLAPPRLHISLGAGRQPPPPLPIGPWRARGLLLWAHAGPAAGQGNEHDGAFWTPLVACAFRG
jgi:hypothetical protein